ncbi:hypothetical protein RB195_004105 [Necator americanus]|uniref:Uncharacterized protein n=1 Tax=Necator americanus TaxID=51031 RepID=A0ABR1BJU1_NECAM
MTQIDDDSCDVPDDHWIFEELGSPVKSRKMKSSSAQSSCPKNVMEQSEFDEKLKVYSSNMRKLIITARGEINRLKQENTTLQRKLESSGLIECPACLFRFVPQKEHRVLPKYIKVFRGRLSLEIEFNTLDELDHWIIANQLDMNSDGLPTVAHESKKDKSDLAASGSLLPQLIKEKHSNTKRERVVISMRHRSKNVPICERTDGETTKTESSEVFDAVESGQCEVKDGSEEFGSHHETLSDLASTSFFNESKRNQRLRDQDSITSKNEDVPERIARRDRSKCKEESRTSEKSSRDTEGKSLEKSDILAKLRDETEKVTHSKHEEKIKENGDRHVARERSQHSRNSVKTTSSRPEKLLEGVEEQRSRHSSKEASGKENSYRNSKESDLSRDADDNSSHHRASDLKKERKDERPRSLVSRSNHDHKSGVRKEKDVDRKPDSGKVKEHIHTSNKSHTGSSSHSRSSSRLETTSAEKPTDRGKESVKEELKRHDARRSSRPGESSKSHYSLESRRRNRRPSDRRSPDRACRDGNNRRSLHRLSEREKRKHSRSREVPRKRAGSEFSQSSSASSKRLCTVEKHDELEESDYRNRNAEIPNEEWKESTDATFYEDECTISDDDLVIVDEEEVEDGEILE